MIDKIRSIIEGYSTKSYARLLKKYPDILEWLSVQTAEYPTKSVNEQLYIVLVSLPKSKPCGKHPSFSSYNKGYREFCGPKSSCECSQTHQSTVLTDYHNTSSAQVKSQTGQRAKATMQRRYGVDNAMHVPEIKAKQEKTNLERYGATSPLANADVQQRIKQINLDKLGVEYPFQSHAVIDKAHNTSRTRYGNDFMKGARQTYLDQHDNQNPFVVNQAKIKQRIEERYNVQHPMQSAEVVARAKNTLLKNHKVANPAQLHIPADSYKILEDREQLFKLCDRHSLKELTEILGVSETIIWNRHDRYEFDFYSRSVRSQYEEEIAYWLSQQGVSYIRNYKLCSKTVDFLINDTIAIEFNGLYTHSENSFYGQQLKIDSKYHYNKFVNCAAQNIQLFTIFEDEWNTSKEIIKNKLMISLGLGQRGAAGRKLSVCSVDHITARAFLAHYHLQGAVNSSVYLGAFEKDQLVGVMSFIQRNTGSWELNRFASDQKMRNGLFSKMLAYFERNYKHNEIYSFSDNRWSKGNVYQKNGFTLDKHLAPDYAVTNYHIREHKFKWRKARIAARFGVDVGNKTELELIRSLKWDRIWDCGKVRWIKTK